MQLVPVPIAAALGIEIIVKTWRIKINRSVFNIYIRNCNKIISLP